MKKALSAVIMSALAGMVLQSCAFRPFKGETIVSPRFKPEAKTIGLMCEISNPNALHLWYLQHLTQALIRNGYPVIERLQFENVLKELDLDQTGYVSKEGTESEGKKKGGKDSELGIFTPSNLKQIGKLYGINYLGVCGQWPDNRVYFRIIDCETAEVMATMVFSMPYHIDPLSGALYYTERLNFARNTADLLVLSLKYAAQVKDGKGNPRMVFLDISSKKRKEGKSSGVEKILFQKKIKYGASPLYATISTINYELVDK